MGGHAVRHALVTAAAALLVACSADPGGGTYQAPQPEVTALVEGAGDASGLPLSARFEVYVEDDGRALRLRINNTSPDASSAVADGPLLTAVGFNLAGAFPLDCLELVPAVEYDGSALLGLASGELSGGDAVFCRNRVEQGAAEEPFVVTLTSGDWAAGVGRAENRDVRLRIAEACEGDFVFTEEMLLEAPRSRVAGEARQWVASFTRVGIDGADSGCALGDSARAPRKPAIRQTWTRFIASTAETEPSASSRQPQDTRAGSVEARYQGRFDREGSPTAPDEAVAVLSLRNGAGEILEQWHLNDPNAPASIGDGDCDPATGHPRCYVYDDGGSDGEVAVDLPQTVADSNAGFDDEGARATIRAAVGFAPGDGAAPRRFLRVRWERPITLERARLDLRVQADGNRDGSSEDDPFVTLYRARWSGAGADFVAPPVRVVEQTATSVVLEIDVSAAEHYVFAAYGGQR